MFLFALSTLSVEAQVRAEDTKLGPTPGLQFKLEGMMSSFEWGQGEAEKEELQFNTEFTFNRHVLAGARLRGGTVRTEEQEGQGYTASVLAKALLYRTSWGGGVGEISISAETDVAVQQAEILADPIVNEELQFGAVGATKVTLALYGAYGPRTRLISGEAELKPGLPGHLFRVNYGEGWYLLPYQTSRRQVIAGVEASIEGRLPAKDECGCKVVETGGFGVMITPTLRFVLSPRMSISTAMTLPVVERYGARELRETRSFQVGLKIVL